jgi:hypothetical protein
MKKIIYCNECNCGKCNSCSNQVVVDEITICDTCGETLKLGTPIELSFGYSSSLDGNDYDFCGLKCANIFLNAELKKEQK